MAPVEPGERSEASSGAVIPEAFLPKVSAEMCLVDDVEHYAVRISTPTFEINVVMHPTEAAKLAQVRQTPWLSGALEIGKCAGSAVWWAVEERGTPYLSILVGHDDQTWDIGFTLPVSTLDAIAQEVADLKRSKG